MTTVALSLPYPVSTNRYWRTFRGRQVVSAEAKTYKRHAAIMARQAGRRAVFDGPVVLRIVLRPRKPLRAGKGLPRRLDLDNTLKVAIDALQGVVFRDDRQLVDIRALVGEPVPGGGLDVQATEIEQWLPLA